MQDHELTFIEPTTNIPTCLTEHTWEKMDNFMRRKRGEREGDTITLGEFEKLLGEFKTYYINQFEPNNPARVTSAMAFKAVSYWILHATNRYTK